MTYLGREQRYNPHYSFFEKCYIFIFGMPIVGLRIRGRNIFSLIPKNRVYKQILDAGSGTGVFAFELSRRFPNASILGIDLEKQPIEICRSIVKKLKYTNIEFRQQPIDKLQESNYFDLILCIDILEHIGDEYDSLEALHRATAPEGILILHVPSFYRRYPVFKKSLNFDVPSHYRIGYKIQEIRDKVLNAGFSIQKIGFTYGFWETLANNLSYMITQARMQNRFIYSIVFPFLNLISLLGIRARPNKIGAGVFIIAKKGGSIESVE
jgi:ubiquinone/menaquinone biosynthesis C-methylase UbiE